MKTITKLIKRMPKSQLKWQIIRTLARLNGSCKIKVIKAEDISQTEVHKIYAFRYDIYVNELKYTSSNIDFEGQIITDELDRTAIHVVAYKGSEIIGYVRGNISHYSELGVYDDLFNIAQFEEKYPKKTSFSTMLLIKKKYRKTTVSFKLLESLYETAWKENLYFNFVDCGDHLLKYYLDFGYHRYKEPVIQPYYNNRAYPLIMNIQDKKHLKAICSPLLKIATKYESTFETPIDLTWFEKRIKKPSLNMVAYATIQN